MAKTTKSTHLKPSRSAPIRKDPLDKIYRELSRPIPEEAIQRTKGSVTKKGYDTTGFGYQYLVNRFNEVLGIGNWNWRFKVMKEEKGEFRSGAVFYEVAGKSEIRVTIGDKEIVHGEYGGHRAGNYADALKGASTNAFKKAAAFFGVGKQAFEGSIDEDNKDVVDFDENKVGERRERVIDFIKRMEKEIDKDSIPLWKAEINESRYSDNQKMVLMRKLEELSKKL